MDQAEFEAIIEHTRKSRKYRELNLPEETLQDMLTAEAALGGSKAEVTQRFRKKLHNVIAPYLEDIDYAQETERMKACFQVNPTPDQVKAWALSVMQKHASTRERLPHIEAFCQCLRDHIDTPDRILDLACALDPLLLPWLDFPNGCMYPKLYFNNLIFGCPTIVNQSDQANMVRKRRELKILSDRISRSSQQFRNANINLTK